jgi:hypothetical protein
VGEHSHSVSAFASMPAGGRRQWPRPGAVQRSDLGHCRRLRGRCADCRCHDALPAARPPPPACAHRAMPRSGAPLHMHAMHACAPPAGAHRAPPRSSAPLHAAVLPRAAPHMHDMHACRMRGSASSTRRSVRQRPPAAAGWLSGCVLTQRLGAGGAGGEGHRDGGVAEGVVVACTCSTA